MADDTAENTDKSAADRQTSDKSAADQRTSRKRTSGNSAADSPSAADAIRRAGAEFVQLTGLEAEAVTRFERTGEGWLLEAEVLELARVPETMSLMASYEITADQKGTITGYRRIRRYERGRSDRK